MCEVSGYSEVFEGVSKTVGLDRRANRNTNGVFGKPTLLERVTLEVSFESVT
jgi:hypothetical protein